MFIRAAFILCIVLAVPMAVSACTPAPAAQSVVVIVRTDAASRGIAGALPSSMTFQDRMGTAVVAAVPAAATGAGGAETVTSYPAGDVVFDSTTRSLVVFLAAGSGLATEGMVRVGHVTTGLSALASCVQDCAATVHVFTP